MQADKLKTLMLHAERIARRAGAAIQEITLDSTDVETKPDNSPVTTADLAAHEIITTELNALAISLPMISEESYETANHARSIDSREPYWLIDPLDGTKEYIKGLTDYTVNIALIEDCMPILGVVYAPAIDLCYQAAHGLGATKTIGTEEKKTISPNLGNRPLVAVASRSHSNPQTEMFMRQLRIDRIVSRGSSIKMCTVAEGQADIYPRIGPTHYWDTAAGAAIAIEAGCLVIDLKGHELNYDIDQGILHPGFVVMPKNRPDLEERVKTLLMFPDQ